MLVAEESFSLSFDLVEILTLNSQHPIQSSTPVVPNLFSLMAHFKTQIFYVGHEIIVVQKITSIFTYNIYPI